MALEPGTKLAEYEILDPSGAGGMGEVYRARDTKLGREVAIKVLPEAFAENEERLARFEREARLLASLNHPNIATLYGFEQSNGVQFLVMELADGETLAERLRLGPMPVEDALPIFKQIAEAVEAAHEKGIIHRDLKPANIKVSSEGKVKVLDFGLAKAMSADPVKSEVSESPTITRDATATGVILGTAAYMSPEQARGKTVDKRTDIWAFGCCLYEALTGRMVFQGDTLSDTIAGILERDPNWKALPESTTPGVRVVLRRCLQKDANRRLHDIADARIEMEEALTEPPEPRAREARPEAPKKMWLFAVVGALLLGTLAGGLFRARVDPSPAVTHLRMGLRPATMLQSDTSYGRPRLTAFALSPDGREIVFSGTTGEQSMLYRRQLDRAEATPIAGTEDAVAPFFSPDGEWVAYFANGSLRRVRTAGGTPITIVGMAAFENDASYTRLIPGWLDASANFFGGTWTLEGEIVFATFLGGLWKVPSRGGEVSPLTEVRRDDGEYAHRLPHALPHGEAVLFTVVDSAADRIGRIGIQQLNDDGEHRVLGEGSDARFVEPGHLVFAREGNLWAAPFDAVKGETSSEPTLVVENIMQAVRGTIPFNHTNAGQFAVSSSGSLVLVKGGPYPVHKSSIIELDRRGNESVWDVEPRHYWAPRLSPDGRFLALGVETAIEIVDLTRMAWRRVSEGVFPLWSPTGERIAFGSGRGGSVWRVSDTSAPTEVLTLGDTPHYPSSWTPDGKVLAYVTTGDGTGHDIWIKTFGEGETTRPFKQTSWNEEFPEISPDGAWIAYTSDDTGNEEVWVEPFPGPGGRHQVSTNGGDTPAWTKQGAELIYRKENDFFAVAIETRPEFSAGRPQLLFQAPLMGGAPVRGYDVTSDGERFFATRHEEIARDDITELEVILNWSQELERR